MDDSRPSVLGDFVDFVKHEKRWWLGMIIVVLGALGAFIVMTESRALIPYIYLLTGAGE